MENIWWKKVANASHFLHDIATAINEGQSVFLQLPKNTPWYFCMQQLLEHQFELQTTERSCQYIQDTGTEPGAYLLNKFCKEEKRAKYRPGKGYARFLAESDDIVLNDKLLWIYGVSKEQANKWQDFIGDYNTFLKKDTKGCVFILETDEEGTFLNKKGVRYCKLSSQIEDYDNYLFAMLAAGDIKGNKLFKKYLAEAVAMMLPDDVELMAHCIHAGKQFLKNPLEVLRATIEQESRSNGEHFSVSVTEEILRERLWEAQVKIIFPLLEKHRNIVINKYKKAIEGLLPINAAYGEVFNEANEVELGTLSYLNGIGSIQMTGEDGYKISKLKDARNDLAHLKVISQERIDEIFSFELPK